MLFFDRADLRKIQGSCGAEEKRLEDAEESNGEVARTESKAELRYPRRPGKQAWPAGVGCAVVTYAGKRNGRSRAAKIDMLCRQSKDNNGRLLEMGEWGERGRGAVCDTCNAPELLEKAEAPIFKLFSFNF